MKCVAIVHAPILELILEIIPFKLELSINGIQLHFETIKEMNGENAFKPSILHIFLR